MPIIRLIDSKKDNFTTQVTEVLKEAVKSSTLTNHIIAKKNMQKKIKYLKLINILSVFLLLFLLLSF